MSGRSRPRLWLRTASTSHVRRSEEERRRLVADAEREAETIRREAQIEAREQAVRLRAEIEGEVQDRRVEIAKVEERIAQREAELEQKLDELTRREQGIADREVHLKQLQEELKTSRDELLRELERISGMTLGEAKAAVLERSEDLVRHELARTVRQLEEEARTEAKRRARALVADALQRVAASHTAETTVTVVELASDDMKGRIIGREGRNIRALEHLTGVDFIIDDTPHAVVLSSFDGLRREIAKLTLEKLIEDGRIHPARIEEMYYQSKAELEEHIRQAGEQAVFEANCGEFNEELVADPRPAAVPHELRPERPQAHARGRPPRRDHGRRARRRREDREARRAAPRPRQGDDPRGRGLARARLGAARAALGESDGVVHAIEAHHYEVQPQTVEAVLLIAADAISASRPGARGESLEHYIKRLAALEEIAHVEARRREGLRAAGRPRDPRDRRADRGRRRRARRCSRTRSRARSRTSSSTRGRSR